jgi:hypothetical protein
MEVPIFLFFDKEILDTDENGNSFVRVESEYKVCKADIDPASIVAITDFGTPSHDYNEQKIIRNARVYTLGGHKIDVAMTRTALTRLVSKEVKRIHSEQIITKSN